MTTDTDHFRSMLLDERDRVERAIANLREDHPGSLGDEADEVADSSEHFADGASATLGREIDYTLEENSGQVLVEIDAALKRIDDGTYGTCTACGKQIAVERLEAHPWATLCIDDARLAEQR